ncbi:hypothetical protein C8F01DRAFT_548296 [Mycena amicta]|nr:hypothetical protein C8F01DRAFT_548296 [Mycena amicta]
MWMRIFIGRPPWLFAVTSMLPVPPATYSLLGGKMMTTTTNTSPQNSPSRHSARILAAADANDVDGRVQMERREGGEIETAMVLWSGGL